MTVMVQYQVYLVWTHTPILVENSFLTLKYLLSLCFVFQESFYPGCSSCFLPNITFIPDLLNFLLLPVQNPRSFVSHSFYCVHTENAYLTLGSIHLPRDLTFILICLAAFCHNSWYLKFQRSCLKFSHFRTILTLLAGKPRSRKCCG